MKKIIVLVLSFVVCIVLPYTGFALEQQHNEILLVPVIMVKNEALVIRETLQPFVDAGIKHYFVFDTGSTDDTIAVTKKFFMDHNIKNGVIKQESFIDFSTSRNRALDLAEKEFPQAIFMIMPDAEWYLQNVPGLLKFCEQHKQAKDHYYGVRILHGKTADYSNNRLIRCGTKARFKGAIHEYLGEGSIHVPDNVYFAWNDKPAGIEKSRGRWTRDLEILQKEYKKNPNDPRTVFYLAQTYSCLNDIPNAAKYYQERALMKNGWDEEKFAAQLRFAKMLDLLGSWQTALHEYLKAYSERPFRAEPLVYVAMHYQHLHEHHLAFLFAHRAVNVAYPKGDIGFVEKDLYEVTRYDVLARSAWFLKEYLVGKEALVEALKNSPNEERLLKNLKLFEEKIQPSEKKESTNFFVQFLEKIFEGIKLFFAWILGFFSVA